MPDWIQVLFSTPETPPTPLSRYTAWNGAFYVATGALFYLWPQSTALLGVALAEGQIGLVRLIGLLLAVVGWFYIMGARTHADSFGLATVADRLLIPFFLLPLGWVGEVHWMLVLPFAILDPLLGLGAWWLWRRR